MAALLQDDVIECRIVCQDADQISVNVLHYRVDNIINLGPTPVQAALFFDGIFAPLMKPLLYNVAVYYGVAVQKVWPLPRTAAGTNITNTGSGTAGASGLPKQTAGLCSKRTDLASRSGRGRFYAPFPSTSSNITGGVPTAGYITNLGVLATEIKTLEMWTVGGDSADFIPIVFNRKTHAKTDLVTCVAKNFWATQRKRGDFGRKNSLPF